MRHVPPGCGIVGTNDIDTSAETLDAMTDSMVHRGPDGRGTWTSPDGRTNFGHRRLAIVGIDERGAQPMHREYPDGQKLSITFNGEIYNYPELKATLEGDGYKFMSASDTEVILHGYHKWGPECVKRFNGIFAFSIHDDKNSRLVLARDHVGVKPMLYSNVGDGVAFASEAKALLKHEKISNEPDFDTIRSDMIHGFWGDKRGTWFKDIKQLEPGRMLIIDKRTGEQKTVQYWNAAESGPVVRTFDEARDELRRLFLDAVNLQVMSDVGFSTTNSGGIDSSAITAAIAQQFSGRPVDAFTLEYDDAHLLPPLDGKIPEFTDGTPRRLVDLFHARLLAAQYPNVNLKGVKVPPGSFSPEGIDRIVDALEAMPMDMRLLAIDNMYSQVREQGHKVVLIGQGPDELFMGYYYDDDFWRFAPEKTSAAYLSQQYYPERIPFGAAAWKEDFLNKKIAAELSRQNLDHNLSPHRTGDALTDLTAFAQGTMLQSVLHLEDRLSMANSIEARVPWLDYRIVEHAFKVPSYMKLDAPDDNKAKWLNRQALRGIAPDHILDRRKSPFPHPPDDYRDTLIKDLIVPNATDIAKCDFMQHMFQDGFLQTLDKNQELNARDLFRIYSLWRFGKRFGVSSH